MHSNYIFDLGSLALERRLSPRRMVELPARFRLEANQSFLPCLIRDIGTTGVRLQVDDFPVLPDQLSLSIDGISAPIRCRLVWAANGLAGFRFVGREG